MIDYTDIDAKLEEYSEAFDFYMESGEMPPNVSTDDCLIGYMQEVIDNNPQIDGSDPTWVEILKDDLISYFSILLEQFRALQLEALKELAMITQFIDASIEKKRMMWQQVGEAIESKYSKYEVNLAGYSAQFKSEDRDAVFSALTDDWRNACLTKLDKEERQILSRSKQNFESHCRDAGTKDYEDKKKIENYIHSYPQLKEIVDKIGREKESSNDEKDSVIYKFLPVTVAKNNSVEEIDCVETGDNLERVIPIEISMPEDFFSKDMPPRNFNSSAVPVKISQERLKNIVKPHD